jgi:hypothetical protein
LISSEDASIASPAVAELIINPGQKSGTFSVLRGSRTGTVKLKVTSGGTTIPQVVTFQ